MLWESLSAARDLGRLHELASVLIRHGFSDLARRFGMLGALERAGRFVHAERLEAMVALSPPERARQVLQELGPSFVKLGQILATRIDLFGPDWITQFEKLQNQVPPVPYELIRAQMQEDLGASPESVFAMLDPEPLAAASIAQVHRARLADGTDVVVKVRRPGIGPLVEGDMRLLLRLARIIESESPELRRFQPRALVRQLHASLRRELNLADECRNAERIAANLAEMPAIQVPKVHWQWTSERMNVQDYVEGIGLSEIALLDEVGADRRLIARLGAQAEMKMMFEDGFFHADPHPGNVFWLPGNRLALIDFGMVGRLSGKRREEMVDLLNGLVRREATHVTEVLLDWAGESVTDEDGISDAVEAFIDHYHGVPLKQLDLGQMLTEIAALLRDFRLSLPPDLAMMIKVMVTLEGMGRRLDPEFDLASEAEPFLRRTLLARYEPSTLVRQGLQAMGGSVQLLAALPHEMRRLLRFARRGALSVKVEVPRLKDLGEQLNHSTNRLTVGIVVAALIIGSSIVMTVSGGPTLFGLPVFGLTGFVGAVLGSLWLLNSIRRSGGGR